ncbi:alpha/beta hydrolase [Fimbriiglobus ruber]|uniref:alpha/beta hydrolase n=1 Tax=Fimbriiglobus ruber TaxID=1908690 RepID=UPI000B4BC32D|nr:alpha/beta hydrolase [Fimbriiglobus ruber]
MVARPYDKITRVGELGRVPASEFAGADFLTYFKDSISEHATRLGNSPVVIMVHGFMADPREDIRPEAPQRTNNPHDFCYHYSAGPGPYWRHTASWPRGLGFTEGDDGTAGLGIAFGWNSTPDLVTQGLGATLTAARKKLSRADLLTVPIDLLELASTTPAIVAAAKAIPVPMSIERVRQGIERLDELLTAVEEPLAKLGDRLPDLYRQPYQRADLAAWVLVNVVRAVSFALPGRTVDLFCHSLGSRVVIQALHQMAVEAHKPGKGELKALLGRIGRIIIVGGAEYTTPTKQMLAEVRKVGPAPSFYNFMARRDRILALLAQRFHPVDLRLRRVVGLYGLTPGEQDPNWLDLQIDSNSDATHPLNDWLRPRGMSVSGAHLTGVLNHWHYFTDEKNMQVFKAILRDRKAWDIARLRKEGIPEREGVIWPSEG